MLRPATSPPTDVLALNGGKVKACSRPDAAPVMDPPPRTAAGVPNKAAPRQAWQQFLLTGANAATGAAREARATAPLRRRPATGRTQPPPKDAH